MPPSESRPDLDAELLVYLRREEAESKKRETIREATLAAVQRLSDNVSTMNTRFSERFAEHGTRLGFLEAGFADLKKIIEKHDEKLAELREDTGSVRIEVADGRAKRSEKWLFMIGGALVAIALTIAGDLIIRGLTEKPPVVKPEIHDVKE